MKEKLKGFYYEHKEVINNGALFAASLVVGYACGKALGSVISTGFKESYDKGWEQGYDKGCEVFVDWLLKEHGKNPEVAVAVSECIGKHFN